MKDTLAFIALVLGSIFVIVVTSAKPPDFELGKTICANMTCYYEIKDKN